jgi:hypothetical protein
VRAEWLEVPLGGSGWGGRAGNPDRAERNHEGEGNVLLFPANEGRQRRGSKSAA